MRKDLLGQRFGRLVVIKELETRYHSSINWLCKCDCGKTKEVPSARLIHGKTKSCGCFNLDCIKERSTTHGETINEQVSDEFGIWAAMIYRCSSNNPDYGGRGIKVCDRWLECFENFLADMGRRPSKKHSLDRYPNNETGNYEPSNCRWGTKKQQAGNTRSNRWLEYKGRKMILSDWREELGLSSHKHITHHLKMGKTFEWIYEYFSNKLK